ncbi:MAG: hypothetical protein IT331_19090 [Anaerolineae bacterium]|nr:hypothetical protein [Anaerolineae bacterium]
MSGKIVFGKLYGLEISAKPSAFVGFVGLWTGLGALGYFVIGLTGVESVVGGLVCAFLHFLSELFHQLGHAGAARRTGYPMRGVRYFWVLGMSLYPRDEPPLSGKIHIRRALGGPAVSFVVTVIAFLILLIAQNTGGLFYWIALWFFIDNFLLFFLGAFLPLGFTDGSTILNWRGKP